MKKTSEFLYEAAKAHVKDKDTALQDFIQTNLDRTQQIFSYAGLPDSLPQDELENILQRNGHCLIAKVNGELYAFDGSFGGEPDVYNRPTQYIVANPALQHFKTYTIGEDCVLMKNDYHSIGLMPLIQKYGVLMLDTEISLNTIAVLSRITMLPSAPDDRTKASADLFVKKIMDGDFSVIGSNAFFEGLKLHTSTTTNGNIVNQIVELMQYYRGTFYNELGLQANFNMKREHLTADEVAMNIDTLLPFVENMYNERVRAVSAINELFGAEIVVDYNGAWKATHEQSDKEKNLADTDATTPVEEVVQEMEEAAVAAIETPTDNSDSGEVPVDDSDGGETPVGDSDAVEAPTSDSDGGEGNDTADGTEAEIEPSEGETDGNKEEGADDEESERDSKP